jgi:hypothetical protein
VFNAMWPTVQQALAQYVIPPTGDSRVGVTRVMVAGQSLGGGVASLVAYAVRGVPNRRGGGLQAAGCVVAGCRLQAQRRCS